MKKTVFEVGKFKLLVSEAPQGQLLYALEHNTTRVMGTMIAQCRKHPDYRAILDVRAKCEHCLALREVVESYREYATQQTQAEGK